MRYQSEKKIVRDKKRRENNRKNREFEFARSAVIRHYGLQKYASNASICYAVTNRNGDNMPTDKAGYRAMVISEFQRIHDTGEDPVKVERTKEDQDFTKTKSWRELRYIALSNSEGMCNLCGASAHDGAILHVDHIIPRSVRPDLQEDLDNLQVLCADCNVGKSNYDSEDWREHFKSI